MGLFDVFYSEAVAEEVEAAPLPRRKMIEMLLREIVPQKLEPRSEINILGDEYLKRGVLPKEAVPTHYMWLIRLSINLTH